MAMHIPNAIRYRKKFNRSQTERRLEKKSLESLGSLITKFFQDSLNKPAETIVINYQACEMAWQRHVSMLNNSKKPIFLIADAFEEAIIQSGYDTVMNSKVSDVRKKEIIRIVQVAEKAMSRHSWFYYTWRSIKTFFAEHFFVRK